MFARAPEMIRAALEHFLVQVEVEGVSVAPSSESPELDRVQEDRSVGRRADEDRDRLAPAEGEQAFGSPVALFKGRVPRPHEVAHLRARHLALELRLLEAGRDETILFGEDLLREPDVRDPDDLVFAQLPVVAMDRDLAERTLIGAVEGAVAVVVADGVGRRNEAEPTGVEQRIEPRQVLARSGDRTGDRERHRNALADCAVQERPHAAQEPAPETRQALLQEFAQAPDVSDRAVDEPGLVSCARAGALVLAGGGHGRKVYE